MTSESHATPSADFSARVDIERLQRDVPVITDIDDLAAPGIFDDDDDLEQFLDFVREDRRLGIG